MEFLAWLENRGLGDPGQYIHNPAFWYKMLLIVLAGLNVTLFYVTGLSQRVDALESVGVMYWGRLLPFIGNAF